MSTITHLYSIYDRKAQYYLPPFNSRSEAEAVRTFTEAVMTSETPISQYPADFDLVQIGSMDLDSGAVGGLDHIKIVINGLVALESAQRQRRQYQQILNSDASSEAQATAS